MQQKHSSLTNLLNEDLLARNYFNKLPDYVKDHIKTREQNVNTFENLKDFAENLLRGDC